MQDLEFLGLLGSPHSSAGRIPTQLGLRMFVDGLLEVGDLDGADRQKIDRPDAAAIRTWPRCWIRWGSPVWRYTWCEPCFDPET